MAIRDVEVVSSKADVPEEVSPIEVIVWGRVVEDMSFRFEVPFNFNVGAFTENYSFFKHLHYYGTVKSQNYD